MANAAAEAADREVTARLEKVEDAEPEHMLQSDGYIFCAPEKLAALSGAMKDFFDRCYHPLQGQIEGRRHAQMMCAGSDGSNAARQTARIAQGWRLREMQEPLIVCTHAQTPEDILAKKTTPEDQLQLCRDLCSAIGAGLSMGAF